MERVAEMELHAHLALDELAAKGLESLLVRRRRDAQGQLAAEAVGHPLAPPARGLRGEDIYTTVADLLSR